MKRAQCKSTPLCSSDVPVVDGPLTAGDTLNLRGLLGIRCYKTVCLLNLKFAQSVRFTADFLGLAVCMCWADLLGCSQSAFWLNSWLLEDPFLLAMQR